MDKIEWNKIKKKPKRKQWTTKDLPKNKQTKIIKNNVQSKSKIFTID